MIPEHACAALPLCRLFFYCSSAAKATVTVVP